jgi:NAD+ synthase (glutamine-hydrolysing)
MKFKNQGGNWMEDLALQNIQARTRLVTSYLISQTLQAKGLNKKFLLVVGTGNCSEVNRGYFTKYDNSSGDINLIGDLCKQEIFNLIRYFANEGYCYYWAKAKLDYEKGKFDFLYDLVKAKPTAELRPKNSESEGSSNCRSE